MKSAAHILSESDKGKITSAIREAERYTSGEIKVYLEKYCDEEVKFRALKVFYELGMQHTVNRTGVLIYMAYKEKVFAIIGDEGINQKVSEHFWPSVKEEMQKHFSSENVAEGLLAGIHSAGEKLKLNFPIQPGDENELTDEIIIADE